MFDEEYHTPSGPEESYTGHEYEPPSDPDYVRKKKSFFKFFKGTFALQFGAAAVMLALVANNAVADPLIAQDTGNAVENAIGDDGGSIPDIIDEDRALVVTEPADDADDPAVNSNNGLPVTDTTDPGYTAANSGDDKNGTPKPVKDDAKTVEKTVTRTIESITFTDCPACNGTGGVCSLCGGDGIFDCNVCNNGIETCVVCHGAGKHICYGCWGEGKNWCRSCNRTGVLSEFGGITCPSCNGTGWEGPCNHCDGSGYSVCEECGGAGSYVCMHCHGQLWTVCPDCHGNPAACSSCNGTGKKKTIHYTTVTEITDSNKGTNKEAEDTTAAERPAVGKTVTEETK